MNRPRPSALVILAAIATAIVAGGCGDRPRDVLEQMGRAYRAADTYSDEGRVVVRQTKGETSDEVTLPFQVAFSRPDRIRIEAYDARIAADGETLRAAVGSVPGQVLSEPVVTPLSLDQIFADDAVRVTLAEGEAGCPTQLALLMADDTIDLILADATGPPRLVGHETVDGQACSRIAVAKPDGLLELWIDRRTKLLRRMTVPTGADAWRESSAE